MIIADPDKKHPGEDLLVDIGDPTQSFATPHPGPSTSSGGTHNVPLEPPPTFAESAADKALNAELASSEVFVPLGGEEPPPEFTPYEAEFFLAGAQDVVSHDKHLNEDGERLLSVILDRLNAVLTMEYRMT